MEFEENLAMLLKAKLPCGHTIRNSIDNNEQAIRFGDNDVPWILCNICHLAWPMWNSDIQLKLSKTNQGDFKV